MGGKIIISKKGGEPPPPHHGRKQCCLNGTVGNGKKCIQRIQKCMQVHIKNIQCKHVFAKLVARSPVFIFAISAPLKALHSFSCPLSHTVVPFCSSCYLTKLIHSVGEALSDPVLQHSLRFDFDMNLYACVSVRACLCAHVCTSETYHGEATLSQTSASARLHGLFIHSHWMDPLFTVPPVTV